MNDEIKKAFDNLKRSHNNAATLFGALYDIVLESIETCPDQDRKALITAAYLKYFKNELTFEELQRLVR